jgi:hypothetical protein
MQTPGGLRKGAFAIDVEQEVARHASGQDGRLGDEAQHGCGEFAPRGAQVDRRHLQRGDRYRRSGITRRLHKAQSRRSALRGERRGAVVQHSAEDEPRSLAAHARSPPAEERIDRRPREFSRGPVPSLRQPSATSRWRFGWSKIDVPGAQFRAATAF